MMPTNSRHGMRYSRFEAHQASVSGVIVFGYALWRGYGFDLIK